MASKLRSHAHFFPDGCWTGHVRSNRVSLLGAVCLSSVASRSQRRDGTRLGLRRSPPGDMIRPIGSSPSLTICPSKNSALGNLEAGKKKRHRSFCALSRSMKASLIPRSPARLLPLPGRRLPRGLPAAPASPFPSPRGAWRAVRRVSRDARRESSPNRAAR